MYVCLCHGVTESRIRLAVEGGVSNLKTLSQLTGCGTQCGRCVRVAREVITHTLEKCTLEQSAAVPAGRLRVAKFRVVSAA